MKDYIARCGRSTATGNAHGLAAVGTIVYKSHFRIPLPPLETQRAIVAELEAERALVESSRELIARMDGRIEAAVARVWGGDGEGAS